MATRWVFQVAAADPRGRADKLVLELVRRAGHDVTRAEVQRWIAAGLVLADGRPVKRADAVAAGARLDVEATPPPTTDVVPDPSIPLCIVYEDEHLLVVDKPAGLVVHPGRGHRDGTLVHALLAHASGYALPVDARDPDGNLRPGIVHRLDKDTSGLLVVTKDAPTREALKQRFVAHDIERVYTAVVVGEARAARYDTFHGRHPTDRIRFTSRLDPTRKGARRAVTVVEVVERLDGATVVRCRLETGRTHQIRVHLSEQGLTPILADAVYGRPPRDGRVAEVARRLGRHALHAGVLGFIHPATGEPVRWTSALPADIEAAIESLRSVVADAEPRASIT